MWLRVPENFRYDFLTDLAREERERFGRPVLDPVDEYWEPAPELLDAALTDLRDGRIEYVILAEDDEVFQQVSGEGDGPYQLERRHAADAPLVAANGPVGFDLAHRAMHAYCTGAPDPDGLVWGDTVAPPPKRGLRRFFGG